MAIRFASDLGGTLTGTSSADLLWGGDGHDVIHGRAGADNIYGGYGNDTLKGESGSDYLRGAAGRDWLWGGSGADVLAGGAAADYFVFRAADGTATDTVRDFRVGEDQLVLGDGLRVTLTNSASIVLLGVAGAQDWTVAGPHVMTLPPLDLLA